MEDSVAESESMMPHLKMNSNGKLEGDRGKEVVNGEKEEEKPGGGLLTNFISSLVSPSSTPKARDAYEENVGDGEGDIKRKREDETQNGGVHSEGGRGVFNNIISNFFHQSEGGEDQDKKGEGNGVVEENKKAKVEEEGGGGAAAAGGGIINNIVSNLPGEAVPPPDEASILIHSIIHD